MSQLRPEVPWETGQHAEAPSAGVVTCPNCGTTVTLDKPGAEPEAAPPGEPTGEDAFSGEESVEGVMDEIREKEGE